MKPAECTYLLIAILGLIYYFGFLIVLTPFISKFEKPKNLSEAKQHLKRLRGKLHFLATAVVVVKNSQLIWSHSEIANLYMRNFSNKFLELYLKQSGPSILSSVGAYQLEKNGIQLFSKISGDYFSILGLPVLPLLEFLRNQNILQT